MSKQVIQYALMENHRRRTQSLVNIGWDSSHDTFEVDVYQRVAAVQQATATLNRHSAELTVLIANAMGEELGERKPSETFPHSPGYDLLVWHGFEDWSGSGESETWVGTTHNTELGRILGFSGKGPPSDAVIQALSAFLTNEYQGLVWLSDSPASYEDEMDMMSSREIRICWPIDP